MWLWSVAACILCTRCNAHIQVVSPPVGQLLEPGQVTIQWTDSSDPPSTPALTEYAINLCAGGNSEGTFECSLASWQSGASSGGGVQGSMVVNIPANVGASSSNA